MIKLSKFLWFLAFLSVGAGMFSSFYSAYIEIHQKSGVGLYFLVGCAFFFALSGLLATVASKFESEGK